MIITAVPNPRFLTKERSSQKKRTIERKKGGKRNKREMEKSGLYYGQEMPALPEAAF